MRNFTQLLITKLKGRRHYFGETGVDGGII
jgi:hypothetical protein